MFSYLRTFWWWLQKLNGDAMTLAAMRYQVDVEALQSDRLQLATVCERESDAKQQLQIIVRVAYNRYSAHFIHPSIRPFI